MGVQRILSTQGEANRIMQEMILDLFKIIKAQDARIQELEKKVN